MKNKICTTIATLMMLVPWTILPLRSHQWALESPAAEIIISCYIGFMLFSGIFTIHCYSRGGLKNKWMQVCAVVNGIYAVTGVIIGAWMVCSTLL